MINKKKNADVITEEKTECACPMMDAIAMITARDFDEYVEFMNTYDENTTDPELLMKYSELLSKEADMLQKLEAMDESDMTTAEAAYYAEVTARIEAKLATVN